MKKNFLIFVLVFLAGILAGMFLFENVLPRLELFLKPNVSAPLSSSPSINNKKKVKKETLCQKIKKGKGIEVNTDKQRSRLCEAGNVVKEFPVSTGKAESPTPKGEFRVIKKSPMIYSKIAGDWLPFWVGFYDNFGFHELPISDRGQRIGEKELGKPASLGCVRLRVDDAEKLYHFAKIGMKVVIFGD